MSEDRAPMMPRPRTPEEQARRRIDADARLAAAFERTRQNAALFLDAWKRGVLLAGPTYFINKTAHELHAVGAATDKNQLAPDHDLIVASIDVLSSGERKFLAAMCSFYNSNWGGDLLREQGVNGLADLSAVLDDEHLKVLADLLVSYGGW